MGEGANCMAKQNIILPKAGPANWLAFLGVGFGSVLIGMGFVKHWGMMALCRALLGVLEAGFLPGNKSFPSLPRSLFL